MSNTVEPPSTALRIVVSPDISVSALLMRPETAKACLVVAHGAGAGMTHRFMESVAVGLAQRQIATLRFQFPFTEAGSRRPDRPAVAQATVRAAVAEAARNVAGLPLFAGGKSFGGRMTSQAQAETPLPDVRGLVFFGFPLHAAGKPGTARARHLAEITVPMLFLQGTRDALADADLMRETVAGLGPRSTLEFVEHADHAFHVPVRSGRTDDQMLAALLDRATAWMLAQH